MNRILWLASYPRSGNTWTRIFLTHCRQARSPGNALLGTDQIASSRRLIDRALGIESACLADAELRALLPAAYRQFAARCCDSYVLKVHDRYGLAPNGEPLFPADATHGVIHVVRNPLDVAVSLADYTQRSLDAVIARMANPDETMSRSGDGLRDQVPQQLGTWSDHVRSWLDQTALPTLTVRYEDLLRNADAAFAAIAAFAGFPADRVADAIAASGFAGLQAHERVHGFAERPPRTPIFFREGRAGGWRDRLSGRQVERLVADHGPVMRRLGYLAPTGAPVDMAISEGAPT